MDLAIPVVPKIDIPSTIPNLGFIVFLAIFLPSGIVIVTLAIFPSGTLCVKFSKIIFRGTGFIA